ncbi:hypothetical protein ACRRTK_006024 [Alexandromys fortis]
MGSLKRMTRALWLWKYEIKNDINKWHLQLSRLLGFFSLSLQVLSSKQPSPRSEMMDAKSFSKALGQESLEESAHPTDPCPPLSVALTDEVLPLVNDVASTRTFRTGLSSVWGSFLTALPVVFSVTSPICNGYTKGLLQFKDTHDSRVSVCIASISSPRLALKLSCAGLILLLLTVIGLSVLGNPAKLQCPKDWLLYREKCICFSQDSNIWKEGQSDCARKGATLLLIRDQEELAVSPNSAQLVTQSMDSKTTVTPTDARILFLCSVKGIEKLPTESLLFLLLHTCFSRISCDWTHAEVMYWRFIHSAFNSCVSNKKTAGYSRTFQSMADVRRHSCSNHLLTVNWNSPLVEGNEMNVSLLLWLVINSMSLSYGAAAMLTNICQAAAALLCLQRDLPALSCPCLCCSVAGAVASALSCPCCYFPVLPVQPELLREDKKIRFPPPHPGTPFSED